MEQATEKQVAFARKLGIVNPEQHSKMALKEMIDYALNKDKPQQQAPIQTTAMTQHSIVKTIADKPHSYEFGKAGARHKVYYNDIGELQNHIESLKHAGLWVDEEFPIPAEKVTFEE